MSRSAKVFRSKWLLLAAIIVGVGIRLLAATRGHNYDVDSFIIVADLVDHGRNVYASTSRYNYGPIWLNVLHAIYRLSSRDVVTFRYMLAGFLGLVDVGIFIILWRKFRRTTAYLFFFNPISIIITGYHSQFDNLAILLGLLSVVLLGDHLDKRLSKRELLGLFTLGLSLMTKHILFAFPVWLAVKQKGSLRKIAVVIVPISVFLLGFVPYWHEGKQGIIQNIFLYESWNNAYFYKWFVPMGIQLIFTRKMIWISLLAFFAFVFRRRNAPESLLLYTGVLIATSPAIANQYLAIVIPFVAANTNIFLVLYTLIGTWYLLVDHHGLHISSLQHIINIDQGVWYTILVCMLCTALVWIAWRQGIVAFLKKGVLEAKIQLGYEE
ncbi:MAG: hypothetical protein CVT63_08010 [Candidatus Anoxymicrobium japonicum]|uniref:DUF2029 domain-containing protein n=1 Tax=Candidatus Anoxymicrobium japonicum TaxID=2013648 RepID=A0A2N3G3X0_9ACTN|nr:MAG: hypothetical protein CVT63_08010 [Candidatus Anoxymicrobium japonicum]